MLTHTHTRTHTRVYIYVCVCVRLCVHICLRVCVCVCVLFANFYILFNCCLLQFYSCCLMFTPSGLFFLHTSVCYTSLYTLEIFEFKVVAYLGDYWLRVVIEYFKLLWTSLTLSFYMLLGSSKAMNNQGNKSWEQIKWNKYKSAVSLQKLV